VRPRPHRGENSGNPLPRCIHPNPYYGLMSGWGIPRRTRIGGALGLNPAIAASPSTLRWLLQFCVEPRSTLILDVSNDYFFVY
jgi:hypothetical protein